ncbi:MAG TPA: NADH-quinone oxidoreductase subunit J [Bacillales bacterium]|nr:NADH-quinone oxidoreductase subunit J [Bacillales bacterium]
MSGELIAFFILALTSIVGGVLMLNLKKVIHMVVALVFTFLGLAGIYIMLSAEFVAVVQILIYSGAVSIIMLFGIMLTKHNDRAKEVVSKWRHFTVAAGVLVFFGIMFYGIRDLDFGRAAKSLQDDNTQQIGIELYTHYLLPFEIASLLLLVALVGAVLMARNEEENDRE